MRYNIKRWKEDKELPDVTIYNCKEFEVLKQVIKAIEEGQSIEAIVKESDEI